jgi:hypothetical protein
MFSEMTRSRSPCTRMPAAEIASDSIKSMPMLFSSTRSRRGAPGNG